MSTFDDDEQVELLQPYKPAVILEDDCLVVTCEPRTDTAVLQWSCDERNWSEVEDNLIDGSNGDALYVRAYDPSSHLVSEIVSVAIGECQRRSSIDGKRRAIHERKMTILRYSWWLLCCCGFLVSILCVALRKSNSVGIWVGVAVGILLFVIGFSIRVYLFSLEKFDTIRLPSANQDIGNDVSFNVVSIND